VWSWLPPSLKLWRARIFDVRQKKMLTFPAVAVVFFACAIGAYGIQRRRRWAWYCGWGYMFFTAAALATPLLVAIVRSTSLLQTVLSLIGLVGALLLWSGWAIWWSRRQREFGIDPKA
jgi:hypothetical protein